MHITYDHQIFSFQRYGGISRYFYEISNRIALKAENDVDIFAPLYVNEYFQEGDIVHPKGFKIPQVPRTGRIVNAANGLVSQLMLKSRSNVDVFHETYYGLVDCCPAAAKRVITVHDMIHEKFRQNFLSSDKTREVKAQVVERADHVICVSENTRSDLIELLGVSKDKTSVVYHGYALTTDKEVFMRPKNDRPYLLYVGQRGGYKNFERLLQSYAGSSSLRKEFSIVCFGGGAFTARELNVMAVLNLSPNQVQQVSGHDGILAGLYATAAIFVYPSLYEGFGIPPLEAMSFDCPVVCANTSSLPEVVGDAAELFNPVDESAMRSAIERVAFSPDLSKALVAKGRVRILNFSWDKCAQDTLAVYKNVLHS